MLGSLAVAAGCGHDPVSGTRTRPPAPMLATVAYVTDGDTLRLTDGRRVRLVQVDAPELETECYGAPARRALLRLTPPGLRIRLERDPALDDVDRYGRMLRYVVAGASNVNVELVAEGAAMPYFFRNERGRYATRLLQAAKAARARHAGLWAACPRARLHPTLGSLTGPA